jgi:hypothetical protein
MEWELQAGERGVKLFLANDRELAEPAFNDPAGDDEVITAPSRRSPVPIPGTPSTRPSTGARRSTRVGCRAHVDFDDRIRGTQNVVVELRKGRRYAVRLTRRQMNTKCH